MTQINDRSSAPVSGKVLGDAAPPPHVSAAPRVPSPEYHTPVETEAPHPPPMESTRSANRESVDWYAGLAAEGSTAQRGPSEPLPATVEEEEEPATAVPEIQVNSSNESDALADVDTGVGKYIPVGSLFLRLTAVMQSSVCARCTHTRLRDLRNLVSPPISGNPACVD